MKVLEFHGEIGWDLWPDNVRDSLRSSAGEDLTVRFSSIGGDIFNGADIFNILMDHKADNPGIKMNLEIKGVAASMGSAIAAAPVWDDVAVSAISGYMIHNPMTFAAGDYSDMESVFSFLKKVTEMYREVYAKRSRKSVEAITDMMDSETWFFGSEIVSEGFADRLLESSDANAGNSDRMSLMRARKEEFKKMAANQKKAKSGERFDVQRAAACLRTPLMAVPDYKPGAKLIDEPWDASASESRWRKHVDVESSDDLPKESYTKRFGWYDEDNADDFGAYKFPHWDYKNGDGEFVNIAAVRNGLARVPQSDIPEDDKERVSNLLRRYLDRFNEMKSTAGKGGSNNPVPTSGEFHTEETKVENKKELMAELPEVYNESVTDGVMKERERVKALSSMKKQEEYKDIPEVLEVIDKAIEDGTNVDAVQPLMVAAMMKVMRDPARMAALESAGNIGGGDGGDDKPATHVEA